VAPLPDVSGAAKLLVQQIQGTRQLENVFHVTKGTTGAYSDFTATDLNTVCEDAFNAWHTNMLAYQTEDLTLINVQGITLDGSETLGSYGGSEAGTMDGNPFTSQTAAVISWPVPAAYRGGHFRTYLGGQDNTGMSTPEQMTSGHAAGIAEAALGWQSAINGIMLGDFPVTLVGISYVRDKAPRETPVIFTLGIPAVNTRYASQRRRLGKLSTGIREPG
jgi:hypothetical protein